MYNYQDKKWNFICNAGGTGNGLGTSDLETFMRDPISSLARETCQNSIDARRENQDRVIVKFKSFEVTPENIFDFESLENEMRECRKFREDDKETSDELRKMISEINKPKIECLRISDFNTKGLDGVVTNDAKKSFYYLTKGNGLTSKSGSTGGSKGIGKFASFVASSINTVFYSTYNEENEKGYMGITRLCSRPLKNENDLDENTTGYGYYSTKSIRPILEDLTLDKNFTRKENEYGTDIYILGFKKEDEWQKEIISKILESFMVAIYNAELEVEIDDIVLNKETIKDKIDEFGLNTDKKIMSQYLLLSDSTNTKNKTFEIEGHGDIKILIREFKKEEADLATNKCVMIRYPYMKITNCDCGSSVACSGMCIIPKDIEGKTDLNKVLRAIENPQHTAWEAKRIKEKDERNKMYNLIRIIRKDIMNFAHDCLLSSDQKAVDVEGMAELLPGIEFIDNGDLLEKIGEEKPKIINRVKKIVKNKAGDEKDNTSNTTEPGLGKYSEGTDIEIPDKHNKGRGGDIHDTKGKVGNILPGENEIMVPIQLTGIKAKVLVPDKTSGIYYITFKSIYDKDDCEMTLSYMDDSNNKYKTNIIKCKINGESVKVENNVVMHFKIEKDKRYNFEIKTDLDDLYASEVKIFAREEK